MNSALLAILSLSISGSLMALILFALKPLIKHRLSKAFFYYIWIPVLLRLVLPIGAPVNVMDTLFHQTSTVPVVQNMVMHEVSEQPYDESLFGSEGDNFAIEYDSFGFTHFGRGEWCQDTRCGIHAEGQFVSMAFVDLARRYCGKSPVARRNVFSFSEST